MLHEKIDSEKWKAEFIKKMSNFAEKSPVLLSFVTSDAGATIIHTNSGNRYEFPWDFTIPVKSFIFMIKEKLVENHYPRMVQHIITEEDLTPDQQATLLEEGVPANELPMKMKILTKRFWRIDRVIVYRDIFIIIDETTRESYRYKMKKSCVFFLRNYRSGKYTLESAAEYFFANSELLEKLEPTTQE